MKILAPGRKCIPWNFDIFFPEIVTRNTFLDNVKWQIQFLVLNNFIRDEMVPTSNACFQFLIWNLSVFSYFGERYKIIYVYVFKMKHSFRAVDKSDSHHRAYGP